VLEPDGRGAVVSGRVRTLIMAVALVAVGVFAGSALSQWWEVPGSQAAVGALRDVVRPRERVRVEVLNAGGRPNMARDATETLRDGGFDVVYFGNAGSFGEDSSVVLDRVGRIDLARAVADALGIRSVRSEPDRNLFLDVSVVLGEDWDLPLPTEAALPSELPAWWDLRRFLSRREVTAPAGGSEGTMVDPDRRGEP